MATFYSFKDKKNEPEPLVKKPGDIDGQMFDIGDCENSTLVIMDNCEQVQIDMVKNCRIFVGACASSIFIRNCENCVFYTCCRQLRLRDVISSKFYIYSMAEVHIEDSKDVQFAPFNGGYPEQSRNLSAASLDPTHNLWYDIFDHSDPAKTHANWSLIPESEYEQPWFPAGPCDVAIPLTKQGSVARPELEGQGDMQAFSIQQMIADDAAAKKQPSPAKVAPPPVVTSQESPSKVTPPPVGLPSPEKTATTAQQSPAKTAAPSSPVKLPGNDEAAITIILKMFANAQDLNLIIAPNAQLIDGTGKNVEVSSLSKSELYFVEPITLCECGFLAWVVFWVSTPFVGVTRSTAIVKKIDNKWKVHHVQSSSNIGFSDAPPRMVFE